MSNALNLQHPVTVPAESPYVTVQHGLKVVPDTLALAVVSYTSTAAPTFTQVFADSNVVSWQWTNPEAGKQCVVQASCTVTRDVNNGTFSGPPVVSATLALTPSSGGGGYPGVTSDGSGGLVLTGDLTLGDGSVLATAGSPNDSAVLTLIHGIKKIFSRKPAAWRDASGAVHIEGVIQNATDSNSIASASLPSGYAAPSAASSFAVAGGITVVVNADGTINIVKNNDGTQITVDFGGIVYNPLITTVPPF